MIRYTTLHVYFMTKLIKIFAGIFLLSSSCFATTEIMLGNATGGPGNTVQIPISWTSDAGSQSLQFDVQYDASLFSAIDTSRCVEQMLNAGYSGSQCATVDISGGIGDGIDAIIILVFGIPPSVLPSGSIGQLSFTIDLAAPTGIADLQISSPVVEGETVYNFTHGSIDVIAVGPPEATLSVGDYSALQGGNVSSTIAWSTGGSAVSTFNNIEFDIEYPASQFSSMDLSQCVSTALTSGMDDSQCSIVDVSGGIGSGVDAIHYKISSSSGAFFDGPDFGVIAWNIASQANPGTTLLMIKNLIHNTSTNVTLLDGSIAITSTQPPLVTLSIDHVTGPLTSTVTAGIDIQVEGSATTNLEAIQFDICYDSQVIDAVELTHCVDGAISQGQNISLCSIMETNPCSEGPWDTGIRFISTSFSPHAFVSGSIGSFDLHIASNAGIGVSPLKIENIFLSEDPPDILNHGSVTVTTAPAISWSPDQATIALGSADSGTMTPAQSLTYTESGLSDVVLESCDLSGPDSAAYNLQSLVTLPHLMTGGLAESGQIDIACTPQHFGDHNASLMCSINDPLSGNVLVEQKVWALGCFGNTPNYASLPAGANQPLMISTSTGNSTSLLEEISNIDMGTTANLEILSMTISGDSEIQLVESTGTITPDGNLIPISLSCLSQQPGSFNASVDVQTNDTFHFPPVGLIQYPVSCNVAPEADVSIQLFDNVDPALPNETVTYTFIIDNSGPDVATQVAVTMIPSTNMQVDLVEFGGVPCSENSGNWECFASSLAASSQLSGTMTAHSNSAGLMVVDATVVTNETDPVANNSAHEETTVELQADLDVQVSSCNDLVEQGESTKVGVMLSSNGPTEMENVIFDVTLSPNLQLSTLLPALAECTQSIRGFHCSFPLINPSDRYIWELDVVAGMLVSEEFISVQVQSSNDPDSLNDSDSAVLVVTNDILYNGTFEGFINCQN